MRRPFPRPEASWAGRSTGWAWTMRGASCGEFRTRPTAGSSSARSSCFASVPASDQPSPRFRAPFDPVLDLSMVRATYALRRASELAPRDFSTLLSLQMAYDFRLMNEAALPL